ncbi:MAG: VWA domain-containing protein [Phycisphaerales bacterium]|nr:VWA domain-containing protein [Phycisphaerales bacterium]
MEDTRTELVMILDQSGSMARMRDVVVTSHNDFLSQQKQQEGELTFSRVWFNSLIFNEATNGRALDEARRLRRHEFCPGGATALLDAIGLTIEARPEAHDVIVVVITDGLENASRRFTHEQIASMIRSCEEERGWEFVFLAAGLEVAEQAVRMGLERKRAFNMGRSARSHKEGVDLLSLKLGRYRQTGRKSDLDFTTREQQEADDRDI